MFFDNSHFPLDQKTSATCYTHTNDTYCMLGISWGKTWCPHHVTINTPPLYSLSVTKTKHFMSLSILLWALSTQLTHQFYSSIPRIVHTHKVNALHGHYLLHQCLCVRCFPPHVGCRLLSLSTISSLLCLDHFTFASLYISPYPQPETP